MTLFAALSLSACATQQKTAEVVELPQNATTSRHELPYTMTNSGMIDPSELLTDGSVIVYPVNGEIDRQKYHFPEYRGVLRNTTASGYTVFDQSVTVYAVDGVGAQPPSYMAEYAVPKYVHEFEMVENSPAEVKAQKLLPFRAGQPSSPVVLNNEYVPPRARGPRLTGYADTNVSKRDPSTSSYTPRLTANMEQFRSNPDPMDETPRAPRLTGY